MNDYVARSTKKFAAAGIVVLCLGGLNVFAGVSTASADPVKYEGTYDDQTNLNQEGCWGAVSSPPVAFEVGDPESAGCEHSRATGSYGSASSG
jgi:hypothetical protein